MAALNNFPFEMIRKHIGTIIAKVISLENTGVELIQRVATVQKSIILLHLCKAYGSNFELGDRVVVTLNEDAETFNDLCPDIDRINFTQENRLIGTITANGLTTDDQILWAIVNKIVNDIKLKIPRNGQSLLIPSRVAGKYVAHLFMESWSAGKIVFVNTMTKDHPPKNCVTSTERNDYKMILNHCERHTCNVSVVEDARSNCVCTWMTNSVTGEIVYDFDRALNWIAGEFMDDLRPAFFVDRDFNITVNDPALLKRLAERFSELSEILN